MPFDTAKIIPVLANSTPIMLPPPQIFFAIRVMFEWRYPLLRKNAPDSDRPHVTQQVCQQHLDGLLHM